MCYGEAKDPSDTAVNNYTVTYTNPEVGQPDITLELFCLPDFT